MYSNDKRNGFSILDIIVKIILFGLFIFILVWLFNKKVPNMTPFYSNVFRENIKYMQEAGESYFTDDKMPKKVGEEVKMTLSQMIDQKLIIPFVDEDGNSCDVYNSYVSITKQEDESYHLKTNLKCNTEEDYTIKVLGCHTYCKNNSCEKKCYKEQLTSYQYQQQVTNTTTKYSCKEGYSLNGKYCYRTVLADSYNAEVNITTTKKDVVDALYRVTGGKITEVKPDMVPENKSYYDKTIIERIEKTETKDATPETETIKATINTDTKDAKPNTSTSTINAEAKPNTETKDATATKLTTKKYTDVIVNKTEDKKVCTSSGYTESYSCNCTGSWSGGQYHTVCSTCTRYVPTESCSTVKGTTTYSCPSGYTKEGSGSSTKCYKNETTTTYSCDSGYKLNGTKCERTVTVYTCPSGYTKEGSGSGTKCYKNETTYSCDSGYELKGKECTKTTYSCPSGYTKEGSGSGTKCTKTTYSCDSGYELKGKECKKTTYICPSGYTKNGTKCVINRCPQDYSIPEGSGLNKKCYNITKKAYTCPEGYKLINKKVCQKFENPSKVDYYCEDPTYKLEGTKCVKEIKENSKKYECAEGYKLEGTVCKKYTTDKVNATAQKVTNKSYKYTWSTNPSLSGWTKTGKTKIIEGKEICE